MKQNVFFDETYTLNKIKHYLPAQAPLKDFVHHNTLHAFQNKPFFEALTQASSIFGYKTLLSLDEYRSLYKENKISPEILEQVIVKAKGKELLPKWKEFVLTSNYTSSNKQQIGILRKLWKKIYQIDLDSTVHRNLFQLLSSYLDQGIAIQHFPIPNSGLKSAIRRIEQNSFFPIFKSKRVKSLLYKRNCSISDLLEIIVGDEKLYEQYLFDQQFAHPGWSGLVATIESKPQTLLDKRRITLEDVIFIELLLEIDFLDQEFNENWASLSKIAQPKPISLFDTVAPSEKDEVLQIWQNAYEWTYYDEVLCGIQNTYSQSTTNTESPKFQAFFCIDDREISIRQHLELLEPNCDTFGTPGHFALDTMFQPQHGKFYTQICPAPITPKYLIREEEQSYKRKKDIHFKKHTHHLLGGWIISQTVGFWSPVKLLMNLFKPTVTSGTAYSYMHMHKFSKLTVENENNHTENGLQVGYTLDEMVDRVENVLKSTGLTTGFAPLIYIIGHGASSTNNPYYAGYDCGACSGRPGSVNARAFAEIANKPNVREKLLDRGIDIPESTQFIGALHDTTRDEFIFYDENVLSVINRNSHSENTKVFRKALRNNAKERSRRFMSIDTTKNAKDVHTKVKERSVSLFEPRPELNHSNNTLCIVGSRNLTKNLFLDQRAFLNSYNYEIDPKGFFLEGILNAATPVCGGINLEYYFSRVDNERFGSGSKLPHNVVGLVGLANGVEGDLRPGLPIQMVEVHDPLRLMMFIEHDPTIVLDTIKRNPSTYEWYNNAWVNLSVIHPKTKELFVFINGKFSPYVTITKENKTTNDLMKAIESTPHNLPVYRLNN